MSDNEQESHSEPEQQYANEDGDTEQTECESEPLPKPPLKRQTNKSCYGKGQYVKKNKEEVAEAKRQNLARARQKKAEKKASTYTFEESDDDDEELIIGRGMEEKPSPAMKKVRQTEKDDKYEKLQSELLALKQHMIKRSRKPREKQININLAPAPMMAPQVDPEAAKQREKIFYQFN